MYGIKLIVVIIFVCKLQTISHVTGLSHSFSSTIQFFSLFFCSAKYKVYVCKYTFI